MEKDTERNMSATRSQAVDRRRLVDPSHQPHCQTLLLTPSSPVILSVYIEIMSSLSHTDVKVFRSVSEYLHCVGHAKRSVTKTV